MKKYFLAVILPILFVIFFQPSTVLAQQPNTVVPTDTPALVVEYTLPYPGLLPDNPLYKLKAFRDKLVSLLISDPLKKAEFDLLQSDKRLSAAMYLLQTNNKQGALAVETISKGENYVSEGLTQLQLAKKQGQDISLMMNNYANSNKKHLQVITDMEKTIPASLRANLQKEELRIQEFGKVVSTPMQAK